MNELEQLRQRLYEITCSLAGAYNSQAAEQMESLYEVWSDLNKEIAVLDTIIKEQNRVKQSRGTAPGN